MKLSIGIFLLIAAGCIEVSGNTQAATQSHFNITVPDVARISAEAFLAWNSYGFLTQKNPVPQPLLALLGAYRGYSIVQRKRTGECWPTIPETLIAGLSATGCTNLGMGIGEWYGKTFFDHASAANDYAYKENLVANTILGGAIGFLCGAALIIFPVVNGYRESQGPAYISKK